LKPVKSVNIVAALRYDNVRYDFSNLLPPGGTTLKQREHNRYSILAPRIGATYNFKSGAGLYTNFSIGFQPPETSGLFSSRQQNRLQEATFLNYEIGGWLPLIEDKLHAEASLYRMDGRDEIISVLMPDNTTQNANAAATRHVGIEYNLLYTPVRQWTIRISGTNASHKYKEYSEVLFNRTVSFSDRDMPNAPKWISNSEVTWKPGKENGFRVSIEWQYIGKYFVNSANTKSYDGYDLINLRTGYQFKRAFARGAGIWLNVLNVTDELYAPTVVGNQWGVTYNAGPPRTYTLGLSYSFSRF
jgi:outer membrane receptor protein involved in Fe transport